MVPLLTDLKTSSFQTTYVSYLPAYAPELNPQEHIWDDIREKKFPNRVYSNMAGVIQQLEAGSPRLASDTNRLRSIMEWPWIIRLHLKAIYNNIPRPRWARKCDLAGTAIQGQSRKQNRWNSDEGIHAVVSTSATVEMISTFNGRSISSWDSINDRISRGVWGSWLFIVFVGTEKFPRPNRRRPEESRI